MSINQEKFYRYYRVRGVSRFLWFLSGLISFFVLLAIVWGLYAWIFIGRIPGVKEFSDVELDTNSRLYSNDGSIIKDLNEGSRVVTPLGYIPIRLQEAFIAAEDQRFYEHKGIDFIGMGRAILRLIPSLVEGKRPEGASTITQQVARNIVLNSRALSIFRKFNEIVVALKLERSISKDKILELYLNQIFLGNRSYGVSAAAQNYFQKNLDDLTVDEIAYLAALPKGPNNYNPERNYDAAIERRNWVIGRMYEMGFISKSEQDTAKKQPLVAFVSDDSSVNSEYFIDDLRKEMQDVIPGVKMVGGGYSIRTTLDNRVQLLLVNALRRGLRDYDRRHGFRGPLKVVKQNADGRWAGNWSDVPTDGKLDDWFVALVTNSDREQFDILLDNGRRGVIAVEDAVVGRELTDRADRGLSNGEYERVVEQLPLGSVVVVSSQGGGKYLLEQIPRINGAAIAVEPKTGNVLGEVGGWSYDGSKFNRATQALRQPGSSIKPFVYLSAFEHGFNVFSLVSDTEVIVETPGELWVPDNFDGNEDDEEFARVHPVRYGVERSRNRMTVRIAEAVGFSSVGSTFQRLGLYDRRLSYPSMVLGSAGLPLERMVRAYAMLANGGKQVDLTRIERVQDRYGRTIYRSDARTCGGCNTDDYDPDILPEVVEQYNEIIDPRYGYMVLDMMQGAVYRGTGASLAELQLNIAGKTGTTNDNQDSLFMGLLPDIVVGVWAGFDTPESLGRHPITGGQETGSSIALPIYKDFISNYSRIRQPVNFSAPPGVYFIQMQYDNWQPGSSGRTLRQPATAKMIQEANETYFNQDVEIGGGQADEAVLENPSDENIDAVTP